MKHFSIWNEKQHYCKSILQFNLNNKSFKTTHSFAPPFGKSLAYTTFLGMHFVLVMPVKQEADTAKC